MITAQDADNISRLLKQLSRDSSTDNSIAFIADNGGVLASCKKILTLCRDGDAESRHWVQIECGKYGLQYSWFLQEASQLLQLFQNDDEQDDNYSILGLSSSAGLAEIKRAYRQLIVRYHPDTAGNVGHETTEHFIRINKAYNNIISQQQDYAGEQGAATSHSWRYGSSSDRVSGRVNKKPIIWFAILFLIAVVACGLIARIYSQQVMVATLQKSGAAFVPPAKKSHDASPVAALTFAEKMKIAETREKSEQAARLKESNAPAVISTNSVELSEPTVVQQQDKPASQEDTVSLPRPELASKPALIDYAATQPVEPIRSTEQQTAKTSSVKAEDQSLPAQVTTETQDTVKLTKVSVVSDLKKETAPELAPPAVEPLPRQATPNIGSGQNTSIREVASEPVQLAAVLPNPIETVPPVPDMQQRIDQFLLQYCRTYGDKNLMEFTRLFALDAIENGKLVSELIGTYTNLFDSSQSIELQIFTLQWDESPPGNVSINGRFKIDLVYQNGEAVHGRGKIDFLLASDHGKLLVQEMKYTFDQ